jgi:hypothetical protein
MFRLGARALSVSARCPSSGREESQIDLDGLYLTADGHGST